MTTDTKSTTSWPRAAAVGAVMLALALAASNGGAAHAAPVGVAQVPATAIVSTGLGNWSVYSAALQVWAAGPGRVVVSAPTAGPVCMHTVFVRLDYTNLGTGRSGSATVQPCAGPHAGERRVRLVTGPGPITGTIAIVGEAASPALPGLASFSVG